VAARFERVLADLDAGDLALAARGAKKPVRCA
jgi:hypothetical protein